MNIPKLTEAQITVAYMDAIDGGDRSLPTILAILESGLTDPEGNAQYEAYVMLRDRVKAGDK